MNPGTMGEQSSDIYDYIRDGYASIHSYPPSLSHPYQGLQPRASSAVTPPLPARDGSSADGGYLTPTTVHAPLERHQQSLTISGGADDDYLEAMTPPHVRKEGRNEGRNELYLTLTPSPPPAATTSVEYLTIISDAVDD